MAPNFKKKKVSAGVPKTIQQRLLDKMGEETTGNKSATRIIQLWPDREDDEFSVLLSGSPNEIKTQAALIKAFYEYFEDLDIGVLVGEQLNYRVARMTDLGLSLEVILRGNYKKPFYQASSNRYQDRIRRKFSIPFAKTPTFSAIKGIFDLSDNGHPYQMWGAYHSRAWVTDSDSEKKSKGIPQIVAFGDSEQRAKFNLDKILQLTKAKIVDRAEGYDPKAESGEKRFKVFPHKLIIYHKQLSAVSRGRKTKSGNLSSKKGTLTLLPKIEPSWWQERVRDLTKGV